LGKSKAQKRLVDNWVNIVLTGISIIQGFVFSYLAPHFNATFSYSLEHRQYIVLALFILCLAILMRVFQTYITSVLDYDFKKPNLVEILIVFGVGIVQYYLFSLFEEIPSRKNVNDYFNVNNFQVRFYIRGIFMSGLGAIAYSITLWQFKKDKKWQCEQQRKPFEPDKDEDYVKEIRLQRWNIFITILITLIQLVLILLTLSCGSNFNFATPLSSIRGFKDTYFQNSTTFSLQAIQIVLVVWIIVIIILNIRHSMRETFVDTGKPATQPTAPDDKRLEIEIEEAKTEDVTSLCTLLMQNFGYIYKALFGNDEKLTFAMVESILKANEGNHALGYKSFYIAYPKNRRKEIVGILKLTTSTDKHSKFITTLAIVRLVLQNHRLRGLYRTWSNWRIISGVYPKVKANELHIAYLAVNEDARHRQVGTQLLEYAKRVAKNECKILVSLCVRENNVDAKRFFLSQGFSENDPVPDYKADHLLGQGAVIKMTAKV
jgi:ribosomal protein S18 acetylase RimI-like enzyme